MNKKGQVFLIIAVILCVFMFMVMREYNKINVPPELGEYVDLSDNYNNELVKIKNKAQLEGKDPNIEAEKFTKVFLEQYALETDPNFGVISVFRDTVTGDIIIRNSMLSGDWVTIKSDTMQDQGILLSGYDSMEGKISVDGMMGFNVGTDLNTYGEELSTLNVDPSASVLTICLPSYGSSACFDIFRNDDGSWDSETILVSQECPPGVEGINIPESNALQCTQSTQINSI